MTTNIAVFQNKHKRATKHQQKIMDNREPKRTTLDYSPIFHRDTKKINSQHVDTPRLVAAIDYNKWAKRAEHKAKTTAVYRNQISLNIHAKMIQSRVSQPLTPPTDRRQELIRENHDMMCHVSEFEDIPQEKRGAIRGFSGRSRKRMIDFMNKQRHGVPALFCTLTYHDEILFKRTERGEVAIKADSITWKNQLDILRKRFERKFPETRVLWRIEIKPRLSGKFKGEEAPHYHLVIWCEGKAQKLRKVYKKWLKTNWIQVAGVDLSGDSLKWFRRKGTFVSIIKSHRHAMFYISKYTAKTGDDNLEIGRRWGRIGKFDISESIQVSFDVEQFIEFRRAIRKWLKSKGKAKRFIRGIARLELGYGFSIYGIGDEINMNFIYDLIESLTGNDNHRIECLFMRV